MDKWAFLFILLVVGLAALGFWLSSARDRAFHGQVAARPPLDDDAFYETFYRGSGVPREIVSRLRDIYCEWLGCDPTRLHPTDVDPFVFNECDTVDLVRRIEQAFGVEISDAQAERMDGSFDSIAQFLARARESTSSQPPPTPI